MFAVAPRAGESKEQQHETDRLTQIGRALRELGIGWIAAYSPQAKGRVERSFLTDQDRLIKELRLAKVKTMQAANEFLEKEYWPEWNARFTRPPSGEEDLHRPLAEGFELGSALSHVEPRIITNNYTFPYPMAVYTVQLIPSNGFRNYQSSWAPRMRFPRHGGIYLVRCGLNNRTKPWVGTVPPPDGRPRAQVKERAGRITLFLIVRR